MELDLGRESIVEWAEATPDEGGADFVPAKERFLVEMPIGAGGMGEVFLVTDQDLRRQVAMKVLRGDIGAGRDQRLHFIAEAQATSQLEHPGIPPVHDMGLTPDGRLYFTMKLVQGRTLREVLHDLVLKRKEVQREYTLHRLVSILERICEPVHFGHEKGVIHRDLKPENIMLGDYGEVHVMDWGLARVESESDDPSDFEVVETARKDAGLDTRPGAVKGTLSYMSPEQARGERLDRRSDIYALGCLLYEILTLHVAFEPRDAELMAKKQTGDVPEVTTCNPRRPVPEPLAAICRKAMATDREQRLETAEELGSALRRWLDGRSERERRHQEAEALAGKGRQASRRYLDLRERIRAARAAAEQEARHYEPHLPVAEKRPLIEARARVEELEVDLALAFAEAQKLLDAALLQERRNAAAKAALVALWRDRLADAERLGDKADVAYALVMIERYGDGPVPSDGTLELTTEPPGAEVSLCRYADVDGVLTPSAEKHLGTTPLGPVTLPMGSYLCVLRKEGFRDTRYPVHITRECRWRGEVTLRTEADIGEGFVLVPAGPFVSGEDEKTVTKTLPDFAIQRYPVTFAEYLEFLETLDAEEANERLPQTPGDGPYVARGEDGRYRVLPILVEGRARDWSLATYGEGFELRLPVIGISYDDAEAYCRWKTETTGQQWRLPTEEEREKAARGVDGRRFAWGDLEDSSLGKCRTSREVPSQPEPVGAFPTAESVYGMGDASGGVWDWTSSWEDERRSSRTLRGGSWLNPPFVLRAANNAALLPRERNSFVGMRCARSFQP